MTPHQKLQREIVAWLKDIGAYYVTNYNSGGYGRKGTPDILACVRGRFVAIEVKVLPDKPSPWQERELNDVAQSRGLAIVAYALQTVKDALV